MIDFDARAKATKAVRANKATNDAVDLLADGFVTVKQRGAVGDGLTNEDSDVLLAVADEASEKRITMRLGSGTYRSYPITRSLPVVGDSDVGRILLGPGTGYDAAGGIIEIHGNARSVDARGTFTAKTAVTAAMAAGDDTFPVTSTAGYVVGGWAFWRLGDMPYDAPETYNWGYGVVKAIGANSVTLDRPIKGAFTSDQLAGAVHNKHLYALEPVMGIDHGDMRITSDGAGSVGYCVKYAIGPSVGVVEGNGVNVGTHIAQYVQGFHADAIIANNSKKVSGQELNTGAATRYAEASGHIGLLMSNGCEGYASYVEAACSITIGRLHDINPIEYVSGDRRIAMLLNGRSTVHITEALFEGYGGHNHASVQDGSVLTYGSVVVNTSTPMYALPMPGRECQRLEIVNLGGTDEVYCAEDGFWWEYLFKLSDGFSTNVYAPPGVIADVRLYGGGGAVAADVKYLILGPAASIGSGQNTKATIEAYKDKSHPIYAGDVGGAIWNNRATRWGVYAEAETGRALTGANKFVLMRMRIIPDRNAAPITSQDGDFLGQHGRHFDTLFNQISTVDIPYNVSSFRSAGYSKDGVGTGIYVSDSLATSGLAAAHPRFCALSKNGRYFRLAANNGMITVEQGGALGDPGETNAVNEQSIFQAAAAYCRAVGIDTLGLDSYAYSIWMPTRTSPPQVNFFHTYDGQPFVIESDQQLRVVSLHPARSRLNYRNNNGQSLAGLTPGTNFQVVSGDVWRGCGFVVKTTDSDPGENKRSALTLERLIVNGGTLKSTYFGWPARASDGDGWDTTHKGVSVEADRAYGGNVSVIDTDIIGWRGESIYSANNVLAKLFTRKAYMAESNGQAVNCNGCKVDIEFSAKNCFLGIEGCTGDKGGRIVAELDNCYGIYGSSGQAFSLQGGKYGASANSAYYAPTRINANEAPIGNIDITARYCGPGYVGAWISGRFTGIDTDLVFGGNVFGDGSFDIDLDATFVTDQVTKSRPVIIGGLGGTVAAGDKRTANINLRVSHVRTKLAEAAGRKALSSCTYYGSLGRGINVHIQGAANCQRAPYPETTTYDYAPSFTGTLIDPGEYPNILQNVQTTPAVAIKAPVWALNSTDAGVYEFTAAGMSSTYSAGDRVLIVNVNSGSGGTIIANGSKASGSGFYSPDGWFKILPGIRQWMIFDGNFFTPEGAAKGAVISSTGATSWTPSLSDMNRIMRFTSGSAVTYTVPPSSSANFPIGTVLEIEQAGAGVITIAPGAGVTLMSRGGLLSTAGQYATVFIRKDAAEEWTVYGDRA